MGRLSMDTVREEIQASEFKLITEEYINLETELELECPKGHKVYRSLKKFRRDDTCPTCVDSMKQSFELQMKVPPKKKDVYRIIALDQSTTATGYSIYDNTDLIKSGTFTAKSDDIVKRISQVHQWLVSMIHEIKPDCVVLEDIQKQYNVKTFKHLAWLQGVLLIAVVEAGLPYKLILSSVWRKPFNITAGSRTDKKQAAKQKVISFYNFNPGFDEAEAILIGRYYTLKHKKESTLFTWG